MYLQGSCICEKYTNQVYNLRVCKYLESHYSRIYEHLTVSCEGLADYRLDICGNVKTSTKFFCLESLALVKYNTFAESFAKTRAVSGSPCVFWSLSFISAWCAVLLFTHAQHLVTLTHPRSEPDPNIEHGDADTLCRRVK